uniref:Leucine-rich repeat-containing N-terminal plant-type domain-containing protein n=1 Tax=Salix viminalis TaxID=40686 RepID=A0A6N2KFN2_SALVM
MGLSLHISIVPVIMMVVSLQVISLPLGCVEEERAALLQLKDSLNYPNDTSLPSWRKDDVCCCDWELVRCSSDTGRVTELYLYSVRNGEMGDWYLNASLFLPFQELVWLELMDNQIAGWVENKGAYQPFKMSMLEYLDLGSNRLDNSILSFMDGLSSLKTLYLGYNRLEGLIDLKECPGNLETLSLSGNNITKVVALGGPTNLSTLYLNNITTYGSSFQTLLQSLGALPNLTTLDLGNNDLRGRILGDELRNLRSLEELVLDDCSLDENSLQSLGALSSLKNLSLQELSGVAQKWARVTRNNIVKAARPKADNICQVGSGCYIWYQSRPHWLSGCADGVVELLKGGSEVCSYYQEQNLEGGKAQSGQNMAGFLNLKNLELSNLSYSTLNSSNIFQTIGTMTSLKTLML